MTEPNAALAYRVIDHIDAHPEQWNQGWWFTVTDCGTAACFAGWACTLSGDRPQIGDRALYFSCVETDEGLKDASERAQDLLGISKEQADDLFDPRNTREDLGRLVAEIFGPRPAGPALVNDHVFRLPKPGTGHLCAYMNCGLPRNAHQRAAEGSTRAKGGKT